MSARKPAVPTWREISTVAGEAYGVSRKAINGYETHPSAGRARDVSIYLALAVFGLDESEVWRKLQRLNSSLGRAVARIERWVAKDAAFRDMLTEMAGRARAMAEARAGTALAPPAPPVREAVAEVKTASGLTPAAADAVKRLRAKGGSVISIARRLELPEAAVAAELGVMWGNGPSPRPSRGEGEGEGQKDVTERAAAPHASVAAPHPNPLPVRTTGATGRGGQREAAE